MPEPPESRVSLPSPEEVVTDGCSSRIERRWRGWREPSRGLFGGYRKRFECLRGIGIGWNVPICSTFPFLVFFFRFNSRWPYSERIFDPFPVPQREGPVISAKTYQTRKCRNILKTGSIYKTDQEIIDILLSRNPHQKGLYFYTTTCRWITNHQRTQQTIIRYDGSPEYLSTAYQRICRSCWVFSSRWLERLGKNLWENWKEQVQCLYWKLYDM